MMSKLLVAKSEFESEVFQWFMYLFSGDFQFRSFQHC